jgi:hypothetical protein
MTGTAARDRLGPLAAELRRVLAEIQAEAVRAQQYLGMVERNLRSALVSDVPAPQQ